MSAPAPKRCTCQNGPCEGECGYDPAAWEAYEAAAAPAPREPTIVVNGRPLTTAQAMAVRVAVTSFRLELHADDGEHMAALGPVGPLYDANLAEVEQVMLAEPTSAPPSPEVVTVTGEDAAALFALANLPEPQATAVRAYVGRLLAAERTRAAAEVAELRAEAQGLRDAMYVGHAGHSCKQIGEMADRALAGEAEAQKARDEARAEVERLRGELRSTLDYLSTARRVADQHEAEAKRLDGIAGALADRNGKLRAVLNAHGIDPDAP